MDGSFLLDVLFPSSWWRQRWLPARVAIAALQFGLLALIPAALVAGSGGYGEDFDAITCGVIVAAAATVGGVIAGLTAPSARRRAEQDARGPDATH